MGKHEKTTTDNYWENSNWNIDRKQRIEFPVTSILYLLSCNQQVLLYMKVTAMKKYQNRKNEGQNGSPHPIPSVISGAAGPATDCGPRWPTYTAARLNPYANVQQWQNMLGV